MNYSIKSRVDGYDWIFDVDLSSLDPMLLKTVRTF